MVWIFHSKTQRPDETLATTKPVWLKQASFFVVLYRGVIADSPFLSRYLGQGRGISY